MYGTTSTLALGVREKLVRPYAQVQGYRDAMWEEPGEGNGENEYCWGSPRREIDTTIYTAYRQRARGVCVLGSGKNNKYSSFGEQCERAKYNQLNWDSGARFLDVNVMVSGLGEHSVDRARAWV